MYPQVNKETLYLPTLRISYQGEMSQLSHGKNVFVVPCPFYCLSSKQSAWLLSITLSPYSPSITGYNSLCKSNCEYLLLSYIWNTPKSTDCQCMRLPENLPYLQLLCFFRLFRIFSAMQSSLSTLFIQASCYPCLTTLKCT